MYFLNPLIILVVVIVISLATRMGIGRGQRSPVLVLKKFDIDESENSDLFVSILGRPQGLMAWVLSAMGLDDETSLDVYRTKIEFKSGSLFGQIYRITPLPSVATTCCGFSKPFGLIFMGGISLVFGIVFLIFSIILSLVLILFAVGCLFAYSLSKTMMISVESSGGAVIRLVFKRSIMENVAVDIAQAKRSIELINHLVCKSQE